MHVDLLTLYFLAVGTLFASALMTLWEHKAHPWRSKSLKTLAAGYATLAIGCAAITLRSKLPGVWGAALSNLVVVTGYLLVLQGAASLNGRRYGSSAIAILLLLAITWATWGAHRPDAMWYYTSAIPIAVASGLTSYELLRGDGLKWVQSRHVAVMVTGAHALFYVFRACMLPWLADRYGQEFVASASKITVYEGVLYSVVMPMALLRLIREETHGQLMHDSRTDYLTRLGNRRSFFEEGERMLRVDGAFHPVWLLTFDLDRFKTINDRYGHEMGDEVLKSFAGIARGAMGQKAILCRIGGEEFAALLPGHDRLQAQAVGEAIAERFARTTTHGSNGVGIQATVSIGLAQYGVEASTLADLLAVADAALYSAKSLGGNRLESQTL